MIDDVHTWLNYIDERGGGGKVSLIILDYLKEYLFLCLHLISKRSACVRCVSGVFQLA